MKKRWWKWAAWTVVGLGVVALLVRAFQPSPVLVDTAVVSRGMLSVTVDDDGWTRVRERYTITAPIEGRLLRTRLDPGDAVSAHDTVVAEFAPVSPNLLDARSRAEAVARVSRAEASMREMAARRDQASADLDLATSELQRVRELVETSVRSIADLEAAERNERSAREGLRAAEFAVQVATFEHEIARASLGEPTDGEIADPTDSTVHDESSGAAVGRRLRLRSPIHGRVIRVHEESARALSAGTPLVEIGNPELLEVVADYLTRDAVKVQPGMTALVEGWGGESETGEDLSLRGRVRIVEPGGFTKTSALGVEERRVHVVVDPTGDPEDWAALGDGFHVELRIVLWQQDDVVLVPTGALFRDGDTWAVLVIEDGVALQRAVQLGKRNSLEAQVLDGLDVGQSVVMYPSGMLGDGTLVKSR